MVVLPSPALRARGWGRGRPHRGATSCGS
jgi:hypothetical protein